MEKETKKTYDYVRLGKRIQARRKEIGLTQEELSEKIDCSITHLSRLESGSPPGLETLIRLSYLLGYSLDEMVGLYPSPSPIVHEICDLFLVHTEEEQQHALLMLQYFFYVMDQKEETFKIRKRRTKSTETTIHQLLEALPNTSPEEFVKQFTHAFADTVPSSTRKRRSKKSTSLAASLYSVSNEESLCVAEESPVDPLS